MKGMLTALGLGLIVMAGVVGFAFQVSNDLRWIYLLGAGGLFAGALILGFCNWRKIGIWLALCVPLATIFVLLVFQARNRPLTIPDTIVVVASWLLWCGAGFLWSLRSKRSAILVSAVLAALTGWFAAAYLPMAASRALDRVQATPAPVFALQTLDGAAIPAGEWQNKIVVLDFFSESCGPCIAELPHLEEVRQGLENRKDISLVVVASDVGGDTPDSIRAYMKKNGLGLRAAFDRGGKAHDAFGLVGVPALVVMDKSGRIRLSRQGYNRAEAGQFAPKLISLLSSL